ncbi:hypothetical protein AURDEDRAFT_183997 [Auricularia subglabra TFB-10046 SS5]|nr:hypothetical protein AURDEDRAFT_183997 [Auricularia subglabra TFB-10046 SS5]
MSDGALGIALDILARSGSAPLMLDLTVFSYCDGTGAFLRENLSRIQTLILRVDLDWADADAVSRTLPLMHGLREPAPILRNLEIAIFRRPRGIETEIRLPPDFLANSAPMLSSAQFSGVALDAHPYAALSAVRTLALALPAVDLSAVLEMYPNVEQLRVHSRQYKATAELRALKHLNIDGTVEAAEAVIARLARATQSTICMDLVEPDVLALVLAHAPRHTIRALGLYMNFPTIQRAVELHYEHGSTWIMGLTAGASVVQHTLLHPDVLCNLRDLTVHEVLWPLNVPVIGAALQLTRLEVVLGSFVSATEYNAMPAVGEHAGIFYDRVHSELLCPSLREVCLAAPSDGPLALDVEDVGNFIDTRVRFIGARFARLVLRNAQLYDPVRGDGMRILTGLVDAIEHLRRW